MEQIESRVKREIREKGMINKDDVLVVNDPIIKFFVKKAVSGMPLKFAKSPGKNKDAKIVMLWTLDDEVLSFMTDLFGEETPAEGKIPNPEIRIIKPLRVVKEGELMAYAKLARIGFRKKKRSKREEEIKKAIEKIDEKHLETKFSLLKSIEEMKGLEKD